jgi:hypothetical protein
MAVSRWVRLPSPGKSSVRQAVSTHLARLGGTKRDDFTLQDDLFSP